MSAHWWQGRRAIAALTAACVVAYVGHGVLRFLSFHSTAYDLGFFDQLTSNLSGGHGWLSSFVGYDFRGQHWEPILMVWAALYHLGQSALWLVVINAMALAVAPWAAWRLARCWLGEGHPGALVAALATALSPLLLRTAGFDYHSEALTPLLTLVALEAACRRRWLGFAACCAVLVLLKEDALLVVAGVGWIVWRAEGRRAGLLLSLVGLAGFGFIVAVLMPGFRGGVASDLLGRYAYLGSGGHAVTPVAVVTGLVTNPSAWVHQLATPAALGGLWVALLPLALLPLAAGWAAVGALPPLLLPLLSADPLQSSLQLHYGAEAFPLLLACALLGWRRVQRLRAAPSPRLRAGLTAAAMAAVVGAMPVWFDLRGHVADMAGLERAAAVQSVLDLVPDGVPVSASSQLLPHLSERAVITEFPDVRGAGWVVVDSRVAPSTQAVATGYDAVLRSLGRSFHVVGSAAGVTLWRRW